MWLKISFASLLVVLFAFSLIATEKDEFFVFTSTKPWHLIDVNKLTPETAELDGIPRKSVELQNNLLSQSFPERRVAVLLRRFHSEGGRRYLNIGCNRPYVEVVLNGKLVAAFRTSGYDLNAKLPGDNIFVLDLKKGENLLAVKYGVGKELSLYMEQITPGEAELEAPTPENFAKIIAGVVDPALGSRIIQHGVDTVNADVFKKFNRNPDIPEKELKTLFADLPILEFYDTIIDRVKAEVAAEKVESGATCWLLYNMGYIIKTPRATFGVDISHRRAAELADILDFVLVTHEHGDHYSMPLMKKMLEQGKPVISNFFPENKKDEKQWHIKDVHIKRLIADHNEKLKKFVSSYIIWCGEGSTAPVIYHSGDSCDHRQQVQGIPVDVHILHPVVGMNIPEAAKRIKPREIWFSHLWEMGHCYPSQWRPVAIGDVRRIAGEVAEVAPGVKFRTPVWGEKIHVESNNDIPIEAIDQNFRAEVVSGEMWNFHHAESAPFEINGLPWKDRPYYRLPGDFTENEINPRALLLAHNTSGVVVRFISDSPRIAIRSKLAYSRFMPHMTPTGSSGFDLYARSGGGEYIFYGIARVPVNAKEIETVMARFDTAETREFLVNLPLYGGVESLEIGVAPGSKVEAPKPYRTPYPVLFYGSSITQGGCASRPGNSYSHLLTRAVDAEEINLGFSGSGKGEIAVAKAIAGLKLSCVVLDYDHNASTVEYLQKTHEPFFLAIREKNPELPIIMLSRCNFEGSESDKERREVIRQTYLNAKERGDENVYFIDGETLFAGDNRDACTVDRAHPNDLGFFRMYQTILPVLKEALK